MGRQLEGAVEMAREIWMEQWRWRKEREVTSRATVGTASQSLTAVDVAVNISPSKQKNSRPVQEKSYNYVVRIVPPDRKSDAKVYEWHNVHQTFVSPTELRTKLMDTFKDKLPSTYDFQIGYLTRKGNSKRWIEQDADLASMYKQCGRDAITIFCDGKPKEATSNLRKRKSMSTSTSSKNDPVLLSDHEEEVKQVALELESVHGEKWNINQYQIWARMHVNNQWDSLDEPPNIPLITGGTKKPRKESLSEAISGAAIAFAKVLNQKPHPPDASTTSTPTSGSSSGSGVSPSSKAQISREYISQLKDIQFLREGGALNEQEFQEMKTFALNNLRSMNSK